MNDLYVVEIPPNPYINAKDSIMINEKVKDDKKTSKDSTIV